MSGQLDAKWLFGKKVEKGGKDQQKEAVEFVSVNDLVSEAADLKNTLSRFAAFKVGDSGECREKGNGCDNRILEMTRRLLNGQHKT